jgi:hypothetical protein
LRGASPGSSSKKGISSKLLLMPRNVVIREGKTRKLFCFHSRALSYPQAVCLAWSEACLGVVVTPHLNYGFASCRESHMHIIAILANLILLIIVAMLVAGNGLPDGAGFGIFVAAIAAPALSTIALVRRNGSISELISLEIQARKITLRQRIAEAEARMAGNDTSG